MNYEKLNDWQLNQIIHNCVKCKNGYELDFSIGGFVTWKEKDTGRTHEFNRNQAIKNVNNYFDWNVIMPIAVNLGEVTVSESSARIRGNSDKYLTCSYYDGNNPCNKRALVICCIKVLEANK